MASIQSHQTAQIKVERTGEVVEVTCSDLPWNSAQDGEEREMGSELIHYAEFEFDGGTAAWEVWEYPAGCFNYSESNVEGGTLLRDFKFLFGP
ncbi:hypothetical protein OV208_17855 [Corallococcus sp. bb12-1]|uniref:hypothetical protein n=1 Tax=Corallococcus sp. bb12-1 TaxID=2996784 RepID=UPI00226EF867|nr:hypothetical protein [Corallococcus sp. bb12-1]MCY1043187.1 hypothetical protein [Corallococcus sp. bb12-1]